MLEKPCVDEPLFECSEMILGGTQFESVRERSKMFLNAEVPRCTSCGRELSAAQLERLPLCELCTKCRSRINRPSAAGRQKTKNSH